MNTPTASVLPTAALSGPKAWAYAGGAALILAVGVEELPKVAVPLVALLIIVMLVSWGGWSAT